MGCCDGWRTPRSLPVIVTGRASSAREGGRWNDTHLIPLGKREAGLCDGGKPVAESQLMSLKCLQARPLGRLAAALISMHICIRLQGVHTTHARVRAHTHTRQHAQLTLRESPPQDSL